MRRTIALLAALAACAFAAPALAATPRADLVDVEDEVMCVTCKIPLNIAEGSQPDSQREFIRERIADGLTKEQIKTALVAEYGPDVLALPADDGFGLTAYLVPLALLALLVGGLVLLLPRWRARGAHAPAPIADPELSELDARRLDEDLARFDR